MAEHLAWRMGNTAASRGLKGRTRANREMPQVPYSGLQRREAGLGATGLGSHGFLPLISCVAFNTSVSFPETQFFIDK